ncbi:MAG: lipocalin family protein [Rikenellaceae bacterium]
MLSKTQVNDEFAFTVEFRDDGTFEGTGYLGNGCGTYTTSGDDITVHKDGSVYAQYSIKELNDSDAYVVVVMTPAIFSFRLMRNRCRKP